MFIARVHIGSKYMPGDRLPDDLPEETLDWLTAAGAIIERDEEPAGADPAEVPAEVSIEAADSAPSQGADAAEYDEDDDAPEIDAMAGIVRDAPEGGAKKPRAAGRRKAKGGKGA